MSLICLKKWQAEDQARQDEHDAGVIIAVIIIALFALAIIL